MKNRDLEDYQRGSSSPLSKNNTKAFETDSENIVRVRKLREYDPIAGITPEFIQIAAQGLQEFRNNSLLNLDVSLSLMSVNPYVRILHELCAKGLYNAKLKPLYIKYKTDKHGITTNFISITKTELEENIAKDILLQNLSQCHVIDYKPPICYIEELSHKEIKIKHVTLREQRILLQCEGLDQDSNSQHYAVYLPLPENIERTQLEELINRTSPKKFLIMNLAILKEYDRNYHYKCADVHYINGMDRRESLTVLADRDNKAIIADIDGHAMGFSMFVTDTLHQDISFVLQIANLRAYVSQNNYAGHSPHKLMQLSPNELAEYIVTKMGCATPLQTAVAISLNDCSRSDYISGYNEDKPKILNHGLTSEHPCKKEGLHKIFPAIENDNVICIIFPKELNRYIVLGSKFIKPFYDLMYECGFFRFRQHESWGRRMEKDYFYVLRKELFSELHHQGFINELIKYKCSIGEAKFISNEMCQKLLV